MTFRKVSEELIYEGAVFTFARVTFESPSGERFDREILKHNGAVAVVPLTDDGDVVLVRQYRGAVERELLEIPAGLLDIVGESRPTAAARELREETGFEARSLVELTTFVPAPGLLNELVTVFLATGLTHVGNDLQGPEEQHMTIVRIPFAEALAMSRDGRIVDAKTIIGLNLTAAR